MVYSYIKIIFNGIKFINIRKENIKCKLNKQLLTYNGKNEFKTINDKTVIFYKDHLILDNKEYYYSDFEILAVAKRDRSILKDEQTIGILFSVDNKTENFIPLDKDLLKVLENNNVPVLNFEDLLYLIDKIEKEYYINKNLIKMNNAYIILDYSYKKKSYHSKNLFILSLFTILIFSILLFISYQQGYSIFLKIYLIYPYLYLLLFC